MDIVNAVKSLIREAAPARKPMRPGQVVPVPGQGKFRAMNKKGSVKMFTNSAEAGKFAMSESNLTFADALAHGLDKFETATLPELDESKFSEFIAYVEGLYKLGTIEQGE
jgi:hypothetical protein